MFGKSSYDGDNIYWNLVENLTAVTAAGFASPA